MPIRIMDAQALALALDRLAMQVLEKHSDDEALMLVGIERRGADLARRLASLLERKYGRCVPLGTLDINLYRDDWTSLAGKPVIGQSDIPESVDEKNIVLIDDVLFSGRTVRAALNALLDYGRPHRVELLVLIDRGHRELPIQADFVGKEVETRRDEQIDVSLAERDGEDAVDLSTR